MAANIATAQHADLAAQLNKSGAGLTDCRTVVFPEIGYGFVIRNQPPGQPHRLNMRPDSRSSRRLDGTRFR
jgi:hypothetical protein